MTRRIKTQKTEIEIWYGETSPLQNDRLMIDKESWLEPDDFKFISDDGEEIVVEVHIPAQPCRFLGISDGSPAACFGFGNPAQNGQPWWMEGQYINDPPIVCHHCRLYAMEWEKRKHPRQAWTVSDHGIAELLPELSREELGAYRDEIAHVVR